jgi:hypothetical protein
MLSRWRDEYNTGRAAVRDAANGERSLRSRRRGRQPEAEPTNAREPAETAYPDDDDASLRVMLGELREVAEAALARKTELETEMTAAQWCIARLADVLELPGFKQAVVKAFFPDAHPDATAEQRSRLTEAAAKINAAYELLDQRKKPRDE